MFRTQFIFSLYNVLFSLIVQGDFDYTHLQNSRYIDEIVGKLNQHSVSSLFTYMDMKQMHKSKNQSIQPKRMGR